jgi:hypothetical protein
MPRYRLGKITNKYHILEIISHSFFRQRVFTYLQRASRSFRQLLRENFKAAEFMSVDALSHLSELPSRKSYITVGAYFMQASLICLGGHDRFYAEVHETLYVY